MLSHSFFFKRKYITF